MHIVASLLLPARAGGGHSFHGGGGGGGGFSGGGGGTHFYGGGGIGGGGGGGAIAAIIGLVVVVLIVVLVLRTVRGRGRGGGRGAAGTGSGTSFPTPAGGAHTGAGAGPGAEADAYATGGGAVNPDGTPVGSGGAAATAVGGATAPAASGGAPGGWSHDDRPAMDSIRGELFPGSEAAVATAATPVADGLAAITGHDPKFDRDGFLEQAQRAFFVVQEAWTERKPEMSRQVMADGLWQQHRVQINGYVTAHKRNVLGDLAVGDMSIVTAHSDASYDTIVVRVRAACSDYDVNDDGKVIRGNRRVGEWGEDWTFQRSATATTQADGGTLSQKCPNCGAPLNVDLAGVCPYCKAPVMSGEYDWVLARISQLPAY